MIKQFQSMLYLVAITTMCFSQVNVNSVMYVRNPASDENYTALNVEVQNNSWDVDRTGVRGLALQNPMLGIGGDFQGGWIGVKGTATMEGGGARGGFFVAANSQYTDQYGVLGWSFDGQTSNQYGVFGGAWGGNPDYGNTYGVFGAVSGTGYGVFCAGNGAATGDWTWASDSTFKRDIKPIENVLDKINKIIPVSYSYDIAKYPNMGFSSGTKFGLTAQNLETIFPELVRKDFCPENPLPKNGKDIKGKKNEKIIEYKGVNYIGLIPILLSALQEQQKEIEALKAKIQ